MSSSERQRSRRRTRALFVNTVKKVLQKPEKMTVSQWAEKYRVLDESSFLSGKWSNDITPYMVGIMDCFNDPYVQEINFCKPTQVGGTELIQLSREHEGQAYAGCHIISNGRGCVVEDDIDTAVEVLREHWETGTNATAAITMMRNYIKEEDT